MSHEIFGVRGRTRGRAHVPDRGPSGAPV